MNAVMEYKGYLGSIEYSQDDNVMYGKVMGIKSLILYEGETISELKTEFENMVDDYLELCESTGTEPEVPIDDEIYITLDPEIRRDANKLIQSQNISFNKLIEMSLKETLKSVS